MTADEQVWPSYASFIDTLLCQVIYVHCWGGRGRSGCGLGLICRGLQRSAFVEGARHVDKLGVVAACLLGSMFREMTAAECLEMVQSGYSSRPCSVE